MPIDRVLVETSKKNFFSTCIGDLYRAVDGDCLVGAFTLAACAVGALSTLEHVAGGSPQVLRRGRMVDKPDNEIFREWVEQWIRPLNGTCNALQLYWIRCALAHTHGVSDSLRSRAGIDGYVFTHDEPALHWTIRPLSAGRSAVCLNLESLVAEVSLAAWNFFGGMTVAAGAEPATEAELKDLMSLLDMGSGTATRLPDPRTYAEIHPALSIWDASAAPNLIDIRETIHRLYKRHKCAAMLGMPGSAQSTLCVFVPLATGGGASSASEGDLLAYITSTIQPGFSERLKTFFRDIGNKLHW